MGITEVPFGRTELSLKLSRIDFCALFDRRGPEDPWVQGMPEHFDVRDCFYTFSPIRLCLRGSNLFGKGLL